MEKINSTQNAKIKYWKKLQTKKGRKKENKYLLEGWHLVKEALMVDAKIEYLLVTNDFRYFDDIINTEIEQVEISSEVSLYLADTSTPQGIYAVVEMEENRQLSIDNLAGGWLMLDGVQDPGNIGTMVRTADAAGLTGVIFGEGSADSHHPKVLRSMQGSQFHIQLVNADLMEVATVFKENHIPLYGSELNEDARSYREIPAAANFGLIMGNEGNGMRNDLLNTTDANLYIPIKGRAESLNVAIAAGVLMFQLKA